MENEVVMRSLPFPEELYRAIMREAEMEDRTFPRQVMWMLKKQMRIIDGVDD